MQKSFIAMLASLPKPGVLDSMPGLQIFQGKWKFGIAGRDITTTFNAWSFTFTEKEKEVLYLTNNEIPVKSTELTAPRLVLGVARDFRISKKVKPSC